MDSNILPNLNNLATVDKETCNTIAAKKKGVRPIPQSLLKGTKSSSARSNGQKGPNAVKANSRYNSYIHYNRRASPEYRLKNLHTRIYSIINIVFLALEMHMHQYPQKDCPQKFLQHIKRQRLRYRHLLYLQRRSQKIKTCCLIRQIGMHQQLKI